ncbi:DNA photolyase family protein [Puniceicoccaceae bacterium K14]|nr:DNA photolyase family protein [Puniceicoccaceae bacterium K14]
MSNLALPVIVWFRKDLRLADNPALYAAIRSKRPVIPLFILDDQAEGKWKPGAASRWWLHHALVDLEKSLKQNYGVDLIIRKGDSSKILGNLIEESKAEAIYWNRRYEPAIIQRDKKLKTALRARQLEVLSFNASLLLEPWTIANKAGNPFKVFTPFWRHCISHTFAKPVPKAGKQLAKLNGDLKTLKIDELILLPSLPWDSAFYDNWDPTEKGAHARLKSFVAQSIVGYDMNRDRPDIDGTSKLSPYLAWGQISPRQIHSTLKAAGLSDPNDRYMTEIGWREFSYHLMYHFPDTVESPLNKKFEAFQWKVDQTALKAWQTGNTGYPIVDAGMRQLWATGWMHNRVRMIVASFLVKHLLHPWQHGSEWFWDTLVDADLASNTLGWQWSAGCGADAAPYFRIFNPILQGVKFDPDGSYTKHWVPELKDLSAKHLFAPDSAPETTLESANIRLGKTYPESIVSHFAARNRAMEAYQRLKSSV